MHSAAVRAAAHLDRDLLHQRIVIAHLRHCVAQGVSRPLRGGDAHLAAVRPRTGDDIGDEPGLGGAQADAGELSVESGQRVLPYPAQDQVLILLGAGGAAAEPPHDLSQAPKLLRREVAHGHGHGDRDVTFLPLPANVGLQPAIELRRRLLAVSGRLAQRRPLRCQLHERLHIKRLLGPGLG